MLKEGDNVPEIRIKGMNGEVSLSDFKGKNIVVYFYPKDNTPGCTIEACEFRDGYKDIQKYAEVIGISPDSIDSHKKFKEKLNLPFILLSDENHKLAEAFGVWVEKKFMGKKYFGIQRSTFLIDKKGIIRKVFPNVNPKGHAKEIIDALKELK
jgi:peroxiredoxin Q/BCP